MVTRSDVARLAGTSPAVVSYVMNDGPRGVAAATRERVERAIEQLGYRPNRVAASLRTSRTMTLGLVVPDNANPYFAELARELEEIAFAAAYTLLLGNATDDHDRERTYVQAFLDRQVDGLVIIPSRDVVPCASELARSGTPWVIVDREVTAADVPAQVRADNRLGGRLATSHLVDHGRRRIACISGPRTMRNTNDRVLGWRDALAAAGLDAHGTALREVALDRFAAHDAALDIVERDGAVDALFVASDEQALGVLHALAQVGLDCPRDIAIVSFDGIAASVLTTPTLSTVRQPVQDIARQAFEMFSAQRDGRSSTAATTVLPVELVARGSCGCPEPNETTRSRTALDRVRAARAAGARAEERS